MQEKTRDELLAENADLKALKQAAITEQLKWLEWAADLLHSKTQIGDSLFGSTVKYV